MSDRIEAIVTELSEAIALERNDAVLVERLRCISIIRKRFGVVPDSSVVQQIVDICIQQIKEGTKP
jgi:hypothetical protein